MLTWVTSRASHLLRTSHLKSLHPLIRALAAHSLFIPVKVSKVLSTKVSGTFPHPYCSTYGTPFVTQLIIAKRNTLVKRHCWQP